MKLLVVEDEIKLAEYLRRGLGEEGFVVDVARNGIDGLHMALEAPYALVILDRMLPGLDGLGLLGFESVLNRDYPVVFGTLFIFSLVGLVLNLVGDLTYTIVDPRIDFEARER